MLFMYHPNEPAQKQRRFSTPMMIRPTALALLGGMGMLGFAAPLPAMSSVMTDLANSHNETFDIVTFGTEGDKTLTVLK